MKYEKINNLTKEPNNPRKIMSKIAVVYHSGFGHTAAVAKAVARGAASVDGIQAQLISVTDIDKH